MVALVYTSCFSSGCDCEVAEYDTLYSILWFILREILLSITKDENVVV